MFVQIRKSTSTLPQTLNPKPRFWGRYWGFRVCRVRVGSLASKGSGLVFTV